MSLELISPEGFRLDGRKQNEYREVECSLDVVPDADGSCRFRIGKTLVFATVYGPKKRIGPSIPGGTRPLIACEWNSSPFATAVRKKAWRKGALKKKDVERIVSGAFEDVIVDNIYGGSMIIINIEVIRDDGGALSAALNAASMALMCAGIEMRDIVAALEVGLVSDTPLLDLNWTEDRPRTPKLLVAVSSKSGEIVVLESTPSFAASTISSVLDLCIEGCSSLSLELRDVAISRVREVLSLDADMDDE